MTDKDTPAVESSTTEGEGQTQDDGLVEITDATDEELESFLAKDAESPSEESQEPEQEEEAPAPKEEPTPEEKEEEGPSKEELEEKLTRARKALKDAQSFIARRSQELGELRKALREKRDLLASNLDDKFTEDPKAAVEDRLNISKLDEALGQVETEDRSLQGVAQAQQLVHSYIEPEEFDIEAMADCLRRDGIDESYVDAFASNPYARAQGDTLIQLHFRAKAEKALKQLVPYTKKIKAELETLRAKSIDVDKLNAVMKTTPSVNGARGQSSSSSRKTNLNPLTMSDAEIDAFLNADRA